MMPRSLESRLTLQLQGVAVLVIAAFAVSALWITRATLFRQETRTLVSAATRITASIDLELKEEHNLGKAIDAVLREEAIQGLRITIADSNGQALATSPVQHRAVAPMHHDEFHEARARARSGVWVEVAMSDRLREASLAALARALLIAALP